LPNCLRRSWPASTMRRREFNKVLADFLIVGQRIEPNTFACVVLGGHCETKALVIGGQI